MRIDDERDASLRKGGQTTPTPTSPPPIPTPPPPSPPCLIDPLKAAFERRYFFRETERLCEEYFADKVSLILRFP